MRDEILHVVFTCHRLGPVAAAKIESSEVSACAFWPVDALPRPISDYTILRVPDAVAGPGWPLPTIVRERRWLET